MAPFTIGTGIGNLMPTFAFPNLQGRQVSLKSFLGKKVLIFVWASW